jgi:hypothetical protein
MAEGFAPQTQTLTSVGMGSVGNAMLTGVLQGGISGALSKLETGTDESRMYELLNPGGADRGEIQKCFGEMYGADEEDDEGSWFDGLGDAFGGPFGDDEEAEEEDGGGSWFEDVGSAFAGMFGFGEDEEAEEEGGGAFGTVASVMSGLMGGEPAFFDLF